MKPCHLGWWVLADHRAWDKPRRIAKCIDAQHARELAAALNQPRLEGRPLYFPEFFETTSTLDVEHSRLLVRGKTPSNLEPIWGKNVRTAEVKAGEEETGSSSPFPGRVD